MGREHVTGTKYCERFYYTLETSKAQAKVPFERKILTSNEYRKS